MMRGAKGLMLAVTIALSASLTGAAELTCVDELNPEAVDRLGPEWLSRSSWRSGSPARAVQVGYRAEVDGRRLDGTNVRETSRGSNGGLERFFTDTRAGMYAGYRLEIEPVSEDRLRITIRPLPNDYKPDLDFCKKCAPWTPGQAKLARYPEPFEVVSETEFLVDVLVDPVTGHKLIDRLKVAYGTLSPRSDSGLQVRAAFGWTTQDGARVLDARFCVRQAASGRVVASPSLTVRPGADGSGSTVAEPEVRFPAPGPEVKLKIAVALAAGGRSATYSVEVKELSRVRYAEEVHFPLGS
jgi:hypothetical protein